MKKGRWILPVQTKWNYSLSQVLALRRDLRQHLKSDFQDKVAEGERFDIFVDDVAEKLPKSIARDILYESLRHLAGEKLTKELLDETCWRLAGNIPRLTRHRPVTPWNNQHVEEWVPVQVKA